jgi:hypothetical protein
VAFVAAPSQAGLLSLPAGWPRGEENARLSTGGVGGGVLRVGEAVQAIWPVLVKKDAVDVVSGSRSKTCRWKLRRIYPGS